MRRTADGLVLLGAAGNGHPSASQRRIAALEVEVEFYKACIAAMLVREGAAVTIPREAMAIKGNIRILTSRTTVKLELTAGAAAVDGPEEASTTPPAGSTEPPPS